MSALNYHQSLTSKKEWIENSKEMNTHVEFTKFYSEFKEKGDFMYRGVSDSKHMLYNSAQRFWIINDMNNWGVPYHTFIKKYIDKVRTENNDTVKNYFQNFKTEKDDLAVLSFIQHYEGPTPLLDFTESVGVALYFACLNAQVINSSNPLDSYISVYIIDPGIRAVFKSPLEKDRAEIKAGLDDGRIQSHNMPSIREIFKIYGEHIYSRPILAFEKDSENLDLRHSIYSTFNISNQKGTFLFNNDEIKPLEEKIHSLDVIRETVNPATLLNCMHLHKSLIPYIISTLEKRWDNRRLHFSQGRKYSKD